MVTTDNLSTDPARLMELASSLESERLWEDAAKVYTMLLDIEPTNLTAIARCLTIAVQLSDADGATRLLTQVTRALPGIPRIHALVATALLQIHRRDDAVTAFRRALALGAGADVYQQLARALLPGPTWQTHLGWAHHLVRPDVYVELAGSGADPLRAARPPTRSIIVGAALDAGAKISPPVRVFAMASRDFFAGPAGTALANDRIGLALIGGARGAAELFDDFVELERRCASTAAILLPGTLPVAAPAVDPSRDFWLGDAWKLACGLPRWRPDLRIVTIPAQPCGLTVITRLDPSRADQLAAQRASAMHEMSKMTFEDVETALPALIGRPNDVGESARALGLRP